MTKREAERREHMFRALAIMGLSRDEAEQLRRISLQLHSWHERQCNEDIREGFYRCGEFVDCENRDECAENGRTCRTYTFGQGSLRGYQIPNRGADAERRLSAIMAPYKRRLCYYVKTDPRGAALYIVSRKQLRRAGKTPKDLDSCYTIGTAVY